MFGFLKRLFSRTETIAAPQAASIPLDGLEQWLAQARAPIHARLAEQLATTSASIDRRAATVREKLAALQNAPLMNAEIPERAKDIMQGNREEYCKRVTQYLDALTLPAGAEHLPEFFTQHEQEARTFTQGILRPFQVLQEFFAHESKEITILLGEIEKEMLAVRTLHEQARLDGFAEAQGAIDALAARMQQRKGLQHELEQLEHQRAESQQSLSVLGAEEERLLKDSQRQELLQQVAAAHQSTKQHEQQLRDAFANLEPALRKFHRMATRDVKLVEKYLRDPVAALISDIALDILGIIADIRRFLGHDRLPLPDPGTKAAVLDTIDFFTKENLGKWLRSYGTLAKKEKDAQAALEHCQASQTLARVNRLREETRHALQIAEQRIALARKDLTRIKPDELKAKLEQRLTDLTGTPVSITF